MKDLAGSHLRGCRRVRQLGRKEEIKPDLATSLRCKVLFSVMISLGIGRYIAVFQYNEAYLTRGTRDGEGFDSDYNSRNAIFQHNYSHDNEGGFMLICNDGHHKR